MPLPPPPPPGSPGATSAGSTGWSAAGPTGPLPTPPSPVTTCPRHPDRPAGRRCTRCGTPACDACLVQAAVGSHCPSCAKASRPDVKTRARFWSARQPLLVTMSLITMNVVIFVAVLLFTRDPGALTGSVTDAHLRFGLSRDVLAQRIIWQSDGGVLITEPDGWYRLVTSGFMHFGVLHIAFNMYFLYALGRMLEPSLGRVKYLLLYLASLFGGSLGVVAMGGVGITAGASGAVFGLLAAATIGLWRRGVNPFSTGIGATLILNLFITFAIPGISIGGHVGGIIAGSICGLVMLAPPYKAFPRWASFATPIAVAVVSVIGSMAIVAG